MGLDYGCLLDYYSSSYT